MPRQHGPDRMEGLVAREPLLPQALERPRRDRPPKGLGRTPGGIQGRMPARNGKFFGAQYL